MKFFRCAKCNKVVYVLTDGSPTLSCCGENMTELKSNTTDASAEKHVPVVKQDKNKVEVTIGSALHPMTDAHYIDWILLKSSKKAQIVYLDHTASPVAHFTLCDGEKVENVYAYCNLHSLWSLK